MRILSIHNRYRFHGGEDVMRESEAGLLREGGHEVVEYTVDNALQPNDHAPSLAARTIWSESARHALARLVASGRFDIAHFHNFFFRISPSGYYACKAAGIPVVQTLHNYRIICPVATLFRDGHPCEECVGTAASMPGVHHACYRSSAAQSAVVAAMSAAHRILGTWKSKVDIYIALSEFARAMFVKGGLPAERIAVKPNFSPDVAWRPDQGHEQAFSASRLSSEKGVDVAINAWRGIGYPLLIAGDGPLRGDLEKKAGESSSAIRFLGPIGRKEVLAEIGRSRFVVMTSRCYENFPVVLAESYACGKALIAPKIGAIAEHMADGVTGLLFSPGDADDLSAKVRWAIEHPSEMKRMGENARQKYELRYTPERNYAMLMQIYQAATETASAEKNR